MNKKKEKTFEDSLGELEDIVEKLSAGDLSLDKSLELFEKGVKIKKELAEKLAEVKSRIKILIEDEGGYSEKEFEDDME